MPTKKIPSAQQKKMACKCDNHYELTAVVITMNDA
jgi:hypothetical protein